MKSKILIAIELSIKLKQLRIIFAMLLAFHLGTLSNAWCQERKVLHPDVQNMAKTWESFVERVPVSGSTKVGALAFENTNKIDPNVFYVKIPDITYSKLCVEISSNDGRYAANLVYDISKDRNGIFSIELPTKYKSELKNYSASQITILAKMSNTCNGKEFHYALAAWNKPDFKTGHMIVHLLSQVPTYIQFTLDGDTKQYHCEPINTISSKAYNCKCVVPIFENNTYDLKVVQKTRKRPTGFNYVYTEFPFKF